MHWRTTKSAKKLKESDSSWDLLRLFLYFSLGLTINFVIFTLLGAIYTFENGAWFWKKNIFWKSTLYFLTLQWLNLKLMVESSWWSFRILLFDEHTSFFITLLMSYIRRVMCEKHWIALQNAMYDGVLFSSDQIWNFHE